MIKNADLKKRIIDISYRHKLSHLGSCLTAVDIIEEIYDQLERRPGPERNQTPFILSQGHAGLALYVVLEKHFGVDAEALFEKHGVHPNRDLKNHIWCSTGSLGQGLPIALGMALANRSQDVYCLVSDGECAEGSIWEALMIKDRLKVNNLKIYVNANGYSAYDKVDLFNLYHRLIEFELPSECFISNNDNEVYEFSFLTGVNAHYHVMSEADYKKATEVLNG